MMRDRNLREHRSSLISQRKALTINERRENANRALLRKKNAHQPAHSEQPPVAWASDNKQARSSAMRKPTYSEIITRANSQIPITFVPFNEYVPTKSMEVCHVIESMGVGGAQTMMFELVRSLGKYYGDHIQNHVVCFGKQDRKLVDFLCSYGISPKFSSEQDLRSNLKNAQIVVHHRISQSKCIAGYLPPRSKYVLVNHTWNNLSSVSSFRECDLYVSVCSFLDKKTKWNVGIDKSRHVVILNGVENDYLDTIQSEKRSSDEFVLGRCHRMVDGKFRESSLSFLDRHIRSKGVNLRHVVVGSHASLKHKAQSYPWLDYRGLVSDREKKMAIIKSFDCYFYDTYQQEGASIALLESLACGVPVICKPLGGNPELVLDGVNGWVVDREGLMSERLRQMIHDKSVLERLRISTQKDFDARLHIRHTACKYMQAFDSLLSSTPPTRGGDCSTCST